MERQGQGSTQQEQEPRVYKGKLKSTQDAGYTSGRGKLGIPDSGIPVKDISEEEIKKPMVFQCIVDTLPKEFTEIGYGEQIEDLGNKKNIYLEEVILKQVANMDFLVVSYGTRFRDFLMMHEGTLDVSTLRYMCPN